MTTSLRSMVVAHFEARQRDELDNLIRRHGGEPWSAPALSEVSLEPGIAERATLDRLVAGKIDLVVLITGAGTRRLLEEAHRIDRLSEAKAALQRAVVVARGPKPVFVLRQHDLKPTHVAPEPNTTAALLETLATIPVEGANALIVNAGESFAEPSASLRARGAFPVELQLYRWDLTPADAVRVERTIHEIAAGRAGAVLFTTQVQVRHVFQIAERAGLASELTHALNDRTIVGAVGPTVAAALRERGVEPDVEPEHPKMGHLVVALAREVERRRAVVSGNDMSATIAEYVGGVLGGLGAVP